jgi:hypothetical protein
VPTGTVLLVTTIASGFRWGAMPSTTDHSAERFAAPLSLCGFHFEQGAPRLLSLSKGALFGLIVNQGNTDILKISI